MPSALGAPTAWPRAARRALPRASAAGHVAARPVRCRFRPSCASYGSRGSTAARAAASSAATSAPNLETAAGAAQSTLASEPLSPMDVDAELWAVLDMCTDDELESLHAILHSTSPFSPLLKSLMVERDEPVLLAQRGRRAVLHRLEAQLRFLAADPQHLLRGARPSYREVLLNVRDKLDVRCSRNLSTFDLETEVFLHVLSNCVEYVQGPEHDAAGADSAKAASYATLNVHTVDVPSAAGPGPSGAASPDSHTSAASSASSASSAASASTSASAPQSNWTERVTAPFRLGLKDLAPTLVNLAGVVTVTKVGQQAAQRLATNLVCSHVKYQAALRAATSAAGAATGAMAGWGKQAMLEAAQRSLTAATARYSALHGALSLLGPLMWGALALDLALKALGPDYARVVRAVFLLSQVRLVRTHGFVSSDIEAKRAADCEDYEDYEDPGAAFLF